MSLADGLCFYQDKAGIKRHLDSIADKCDLIIAVDGKFWTETDHPYKLSDDGSRELLKSYPNVILINSCSYEFEKRNAMLEACKDHGIDWLFILDSDEYIIPGSDWIQFKEALTKNQANKESFFWVNCAYSYPTHMDLTPYPRVWHNPGDLEYLGAHNIFGHRNRGRIELTLTDAIILPGITMSGDDRLRSPEYIKETYDYQCWLLEGEWKLRKKLGF